MVNLHMKYHNHVGAERCRVGWGRLRRLSQDHLIYLRELTPATGNPVISIPKINEVPPAVRTSVLVRQPLPVLSMPAFLGRLPFAQATRQYVQ
jgi:hypothetical protein